MSLPRYPAYQDTGAPTLGSLPRHWTSQALKRVVKKIESGVSVNARDEPVSGFGIGVLKTSCVYSGRFDAAENKAVVNEELDRVACPVRAGTLIVSRMNTPALVGAAGLVSASADNLYLPDRLWQVHFSGANPAFAHYWTASPSYRAQVEMACAGTSASMQNLSQEDFLRFVLPLPPLEEQGSIAKFLDRETAKIDALIVEQEKLIALLAEKRQATISEAVTRGLNPGARMKDSGLAWLGAVPAHWEIKSIRHVLEAIGDVDHYMPASVEKGVPYLMTGDLKDLLSSVDLDACKQVSYGDYLDLTKKIRSTKGDVVMARYATIGTLMYVDNEADFLVSYSCVTLRPRCCEISGRHLFQYMKSDAFRQGVEHRVNTNTQGNVGIKDLQSLKVAVPPLDEQEAIVAFLDSEAKSYDALEAESKRAVELLKERRSALITAAVTGQIDVRHTTQGVFS